MDPIREYITTQLLTNDDDEAIEMAEALLVMHDEGLLDVSIDKMTGEPLFAIKERSTEEDWETARDHYDLLRDSNDDGWAYYVAGNIC